MRSPWTMCAPASNGGAGGAGSSPDSSSIAASQDARHQRRVADWEEHRSSGIEHLLTHGARQHPRLHDLSEHGATGILLFKPAVRVTVQTLAELDERVAECGYVIAEARLVAADRVRGHAMVRRHYHLHYAIADRGGLRVDERRRLLAIYENDAFRRRHGCSAASVPVMPVYTFLALSGLPEADVNRWSLECANARGLDSGSIDAANELADCKYVNLFRDHRWCDGAPVFLLNAHMPAVVDEFETAERPLVVLRLLAASPSALSWANLRLVFCGASDPARALPGSLRRDAYDGVFALRLASGQPIDRTRNGIHLSDGPLEALRDISIWFERDPASVSIGRTLAADTAIDLHAVIERPFIAIGGQCSSVKEATRGKTIEQIREILARSRLLDTDEQAGESHQSTREQALTDTPKHDDLAARHEQLRSMMMGYKLSKALYVVAKLKIADLIAAGCGGWQGLASATGTHPESLRRLLRFIAAAGYLEEHTPSAFRLTPLGDLLVSDRAGSDWAWILKEGELWWESWDRLLDTVTTGTPGFDLVHGKGLFDYLEEIASTEVAGRTLAALSSAGSEAEVRAILAAYEMDPEATVVDVGGGNGVLLLALLHQYPRMRGVLFDLPYVVELAPPAIATAGVADRCTTVAGSFFETIPSGADVYVLRSVLHDWDDARSLEILGRCRAAVPADARVLIVEVLRDDDPAATERERYSAALRDVNLMVMTSGKKRTADEHRALLHATGFAVRRVVPTAGRFVIIEAVPV